MYVLLLFMFMRYGQNAVSTQQIVFTTEKLCEKGLEKALNLGSGHQVKTVGVCLKVR